MSIVKLPGTLMDFFPPSLSSQRLNLWRAGFTLFLLRISLYTFQAFPPSTPCTERQAITPDVVFLRLAYHSLHITWNSGIYFPFSSSEPIYYFPLHKINITLSFKHCSLKFSQSRCFLLKKGKNPPKKNRSVTLQGYWLLFRKRLQQMLWISYTEKESVW